MRKGCKESCNTVNLLASSRQLRAFDSPMRKPWAKIVFHYSSHYRKTIIELVATEVGEKN